MAKHHRVTKNEQDEKRQRRAKRVAAELSNDQAGPASLAQLQQQVGNRAVQRLLAQRSEDGTLDNNEAVQVPRQRMDPSTIARDWRVRTGPGATEWPRYEELRNILEREVEPGIGGARWRFEVLEEDEIGPTRWRVTPPAREMEELGYSYSREVTRENILQQLEAWIAQERGAGYLPAEAGVRAPPQPPPWLVPEGRRFFQSAVRGVGIRYGEPDLRFFGPRIDIVRTYEAQKPVEQIYTKEEIEEETEHIKALLNIRRRNLHLLEARAARQSMSVDIKTHNEIDYEKREIAQLEARLKSLGSEYKLSQSLSTS